jgi:lysophospholipase L1-like esterase
MSDSLAQFGDYQYKIPVYNQGGSNTSIGGLTSMKYLSTPIDFRESCESANPDVLLFMLGINECVWNSHERNDVLFETYKTNCRSIFDRYESLGCSMVIGSITPVNELRFAANYNTELQGTNARVDRYNDWLLEEANARGWLYLDTNAAMRRVPNWDTVFFGEDGLHYNSASSQWMANEFSQAVALLTQSNPRVIYDTQVNRVNIDFLKVESTLTAQSIIADTLQIGIAVPEPHTLSLLLFAIFGCLIWWHRIR